MGETNSLGTPNYARGKEHTNNNQQHWLASHKPGRGGGWQLPAAYGNEHLAASKSKAGEGAANIRRTLLLLLVAIPLSCLAYGIQDNVAGYCLCALFL
ncbi:hypothetical protein U1Q18_009718 [Sarracenia purpurea var. burkii]